MMKNFEKYAHLIGDDLPYDYESIMHPATNWFSKDPQSLDTIKPNNIIYQDQKLGQRNRLSKLDAAKLNAAFQCPEKYLDKPELPEPEKPQLNPSLIKEKQFSTTPAPKSSTTTSTTTRDPFENEPNDSAINPSINNEDDDDNPKSDNNPFPAPGSDNEPPIPFPMQEPDNNNDRRKKIGKHALKLTKRRKHKN